MKKTIFLAGGCFWGVEKYLSLIPGVINTEVGYANGKTKSPTYEQVCYNNTGHAETVKVIYDINKLPLRDLIKKFFEIIDPTSINKQGNDEGNQYRTGIYYIDGEDKSEILAVINDLKPNYKKPIVVEICPLQGYDRAEEYHQKYLDKNPSGYCHIPEKSFETAKMSMSSDSSEDLLRRLTDIQYKVTQQNETEPPFHNEYYNNFEKGIYVDVVSGEPLFISTDKFESGCGWPSFSKPIYKSLVKKVIDNSHGMQRIEVRSKGSNSHLGHVFNDGPLDMRGLRYCINSAALRFIPKDQMIEEGYKDYLTLID